MENDEINALFKVIRNGPLEVSGSFRVVNSSGKIIETDEIIYLCRCGGSSNKPFCDDTHKRNRFSE